MRSVQETVRPHPEVVDTELDGEETVLLDLQNKVYYSLNATGTRIWRGLKKGLSASEISQLLQHEFDVEPQRADDAVAALLARLHEQQLVQTMHGDDSTSARIDLASNGMQSES